MLWLGYRLPQAHPDPPPHLFLARLKLRLDEQHQLAAVGPQHVAHLHAQPGVSRGASRGVSSAASVVCSIWKVKSSYTTSSSPSLPSHPPPCIDPSPPHTTA